MYKARREDSLQWPILQLEPDVVEQAVDPLARQVLLVVEILHYRWGDQAPGHLERLAVGEALAHAGLEACAPSDRLGHAVDHNLGGGHDQLLLRVCSSG